MKFLGITKNGLEKDSVLDTNMFLLREQLFRKSLLDKLIEPSPLLKKPNARWRARILASTLIAGILMTAIGSVSNFFRETPVLFTHLIITPIILVAYGFSRSRFPTVGAILGLVAYVVPPLARAHYLHANSPVDAAFALIYLGPATILSGLTLPFIASIVVNLCLTGLVFLIPMVFATHPDFRTGPSVALILILTVFTSLVSIVLRKSRGALKGQIIERRRAEKALRRINEQLELRVAQRTIEMRNATRRLEILVTSSPAAVVMLDKEGQVALWNPAAKKMFGYSEREVVGKANPIVPRGQQSYPDRPFGVLISDDIHVGMEFVVLHQNGEEVSVNLSTAPIRDKDGNLDGYLGIMLDVTEQRLLEAQFRQAQKMEAIGRLAGGIAHDFNNLLAVINGNTELIKEDLAADDDTREMLDEILFAGQKAARLTRQLLTFSRKREIQRELLDLNEIIQDFVKMLRRLIRPNIKLRLELADNLASIEMDRGQVEQILMNLVVNANDAMPDGGEVTISTAIKPYVPKSSSKKLVFKGIPNAVELRVKDTGLGIEDNIKAKIFDPFFTTKKTGEGTGQGLAMVYGIVGQNGGAIELDSVPGKGTTFGIYFPQAKQKASHDGQKDMDELPTGDETVLVVEDIAQVRLLTSRMLERLGYHVFNAANVDEAVETFQKHYAEIDLILSDVVMPGSSGMECVNRMREIRLDIPVLLMSGHSEWLETLFVEQRATVPVMEKPFTQDKLAYEVRRVLDHRDSIPPEPFSVQSEA